MLQNSNNGRLRLYKRLNNRKFKIALIFPFILVQENGENNIFVQAFRN